MTNGYDKQTVLEALKSRVGFRQPLEDGYAVLSTANTTSSTSLYYDGVHPLVTAKNLKDIQPVADISDDDLNTLIAGMKEEAIVSSLNAVLNEPMLLESGTMYDVHTQVDYSQTIANTGNFCGWKIKPGKGSFALHIVEAGLFFNHAKTFNLYIFHSLKKEPVATIEVTTVANELTIVPVGEVLRDTDHMGGTYFIGYFQGDLATCRAIDPSVVYTPTYVYGAFPFESVATSGDFNRNEIACANRTYGLNLRIAALRDYTQTIKDNAHLFDELQRLAMASMLIEQVLNSLRTNDVQRILDNNDTLRNLYNDLYMSNPTDSVPRYPGVKKRLESEVQRVRKEFFKSGAYAY